MEKILHETKLIKYVGGDISSHKSNATMVQRQRQNGRILNPKESVELLAKIFYPEDPEEDDTIEQKKIRERVKEQIQEETDSMMHEDPQFTE